MVKIEFAQDWAKQFEGAGLGSFEDFFDYKSGRTINNNQKRDVVLMELSLGSGRREFFMKRFFNPHFKLDY